MTYAISQSDFPELPCHLKLIEEFTSTDLQNGCIGQGLFTLRAAVENLSTSIHLRRDSMVK
jgi:Vacuolar sorting protein 9 (VPS9) domain